MERISLENELKSNSYPGRGIIIGRSADGTKAVTAYFIMGRSENSRNRVFVEDGEGIRTQAFDPSKLTDPSLIIYAPVRVLGNKTIVTNGDQTDTIYEDPANLSRTDRTIHQGSPVSCTSKTANTVTQCQSSRATTEIRMPASVTLTHTKKQFQVRDVSSTLTNATEIRSQALKENRNS